MCRMWLFGVNHLFEYRNQWRDAVYMLIHLLVLQNERNFLASWLTVDSQTLSSCFSFLTLLLTYFATYFLLTLLLILPLIYFVIYLLVTYFATYLLCYLLCHLLYYLLTLLLTMLLIFCLLTFLLCYLIRPYKNCTFLVLIIWKYFLCKLPL